MFWGSGLLWPLALSITFAASVAAIHEAPCPLIPAYPSPAEFATGAVSDLLILAA